MKDLKKKKSTDALTMKGNADKVEQDTEAYERQLDIAAQADAEEGIRQGLEDEREGSLKPAREFFAEFERTRQMPAYQE